MPDTSSKTALDAIVIGAGFAGLYQVHLLRDRLGLAVQGIEAGTGVGGTWYWNRYPGARCDSESHNYCYMFSETLFKSWTWSERYPGHGEIRDYLNFVADTLDLKRSFAFSSRVTRTTYDDATNLWTVDTDTGATYSARYLITAVGCLSTANVPDIPGLATFQGRWEHTGRWPHDGVDFRGKRVGMIGTGSTGIQAAPVIAETAAHLTVFQRTANYSVPARNGPLSDAFKASVKANYAALRLKMHSSPGGHDYPISDRSVHDVSADERQRVYETAWDYGGLHFRGAFRDLILDRAANDMASTFLKSKIRAIVKDPVTADKLATIDHGYSTKRPPIDTNYFETFNLPHVALVDLRADPIEAITPTGIQTRSGEHPLDIIVFATGYDAMTGPLLKLNVTGRDGVPLAQAWQSGPKSYLGLQMHGFPNLFTITGPGSPSVLTNMPVAVEQHAEWIADAIAHLEAVGASRMEPTPEAVDEWVQAVNEAAAATLLPHTPHSWYLGANIPGKPRMFMPYAGGMLRYRNVCAEVAANGYRGFALTA
jgi:cation diffusion facilitator CzcD-associated flavoprotein CzcO